MKESYEFSCINDNILYRKKVNTVTFLKHTVRVMVFNVTFNNISVISRRSLSNNVVSSTHRHQRDLNSQR